MLQPERRVTYNNGHITTEYVSQFDLIYNMILQQKTKTIFCF
jgi:hypothetical protein